jgi:hypothetical protein
MHIDIDTLDLLKLIGGIVLNDILILLLYAFVGLFVGIGLAYFIRRLIQKKKWFNRPNKSVVSKAIYYTLRICFHLAVISLPVIIALIIGTNNIVHKEVNLIVDESLQYCKENYFQDHQFIEETMEMSLMIYQSGEKVNEMNHHLADGMVNAISEKYGLGFLGKFLFKKSKKEMVQQLEGMEKAFLFIVVSRGLEQANLGDLIEPEQLDEAFYRWLHHKNDGNNESIESWISHQVTSLTRPLVFSIWLPFLLVSLFAILVNVMECIYFFRFRKTRSTDQN